MFIPKPVDEIEDLEPYENAQTIALSHPSKKSFIKLDCNEAAQAPSPFVKKRLLEYIEKEPLHWYPDTECQDLKAALSEYVELPKDHIAIFNGCDHALDTICRAYLGNTDKVAIFAPAYDNFRLFAESTGAEVVPIYAPTPFGKDISALEKLLDPQTKVVYLSNPGNPTGVIYTEDEIFAILKTAGSRLVIIDEAYFEFYGKSSTSLVRKYPNLVVTRSFSKAFALAGLRCGYVVSDPRNLATLNKIRNGKNINTLAQVAATAALHDLKFLKASVREMHDVKEWFVHEIRSRGIPIVDTPVNFVLIKVESPDLVQRSLQDKKILIRNRSRVPQLDGYIRITIGTRLEMQRVLQAMHHILADLSKDETPSEAPSAMAL